MLTERLLRKSSIPRGIYVPLDNIIFMEYKIILPDHSDEVSIPDIMRVDLDGLLVKNENLRPYQDSNKLVLVHNPDYSSTFNYGAGWVIEKSWLIVYNDNTILKNLINNL